MDVESESESTYRNVLTKLPSGQLILEDAYSAIQSVMKEFDNYVKVGTVMVNTDWAKHNVLVYVSIIQCDIFLSIIINAYRFG